MYHDDEDLHMCINCHTTLVGLENYISHRNAGPCKSQHPVKGNEAPISILPPLELSKPERMQQVSSTNSTSNGEHLNFLNADFFFSSLELQSRRKDAVFEEVMGIEEVLEEEYEERGESHDHGAVYVGGGKWSYEEYVPERDVWHTEVGRGGKDGMGIAREAEERQAVMDTEVKDIGDDVKPDECDEIDKEMSENTKENGCRESVADFPDNLAPGDNYTMRDDSPIKRNDMLDSSVGDIAPSGDAVDICCMTNSGKNSDMNEFDIALNDCNMVMDSVNHKDDEQTYRSHGSVPPSGHTRGKWIPGSASEGMRKSGNAVEYYCQPCNKNIRNRRSYEAHLSTSCHLKKLMSSTGGKGCISTSEGPRLRSRRLRLLNNNSTPDRSVVSGTISEKSKDKSINPSSDSQSYLMESLGVKRKDVNSFNSSTETLNQKSTRVVSNKESNIQLSTDKDVQTNVSKPKSFRKRKNCVKNKGKVLKKSREQCEISTRADKCKSGKIISVAASFSSMQTETSTLGNESVEESPTNSANSQKDAEENNVTHDSVSSEVKCSSDSDFKCPPLNSGRKRDSVKIKKNVKENNNTDKVSMVSSQLEAEKNLQDEMMLGLELIRTDHQSITDTKDNDKCQQSKAVVKNCDCEKPKVTGNTTESSSDCVDSVRSIIRLEKDVEDSNIHKEIHDQSTTNATIGEDTFVCIQNEEVSIKNSRMQSICLDGESKSSTKAKNDRINDKESSFTIVDKEGSSKKEDILAECPDISFLGLRNTNKKDGKIATNDFISSISNASSPLKKVIVIKNISSSDKDKLNFIKIGSKVILLKNVTPKNVHLSPKRIILPKELNVISEIPNVGSRSKNTLSNNKNQLDIVLKDDKRKLNDIDTSSSKISQYLDTSDILLDCNLKSESVPIKSKQDEILVKNVYSLESSKISNHFNTSTAANPKSKNDLMLMETLKEMFTKEVNSSKQLKNVDNNKKAVVIGCSSKSGTEIVNSCSNKKLKIQCFKEAKVLHIDSKDEAVSRVNKNKIECNCDTLPIFKERGNGEMVKNNPIQTLNVVIKLDTNQVAENISNCIKNPVDRKKFSCTKLNISSEVIDKSCDKDNEVVNQGSSDKPSLMDLGDEVVIEDAACLEGDMELSNEKEIYIGRDKESYSYVCGICGYRSPRHWCIERHMKIHLPRSKTVFCKICNLSFLNIDTLKQHMKRHGMKKWSCPVPDCHKAFSTKHELFIHESSHKAEKTYKCTECDYSGNYLFALLRHKKTHEAKAMVKCSICLNEVLPQNLERHMKIHDKDEIFSCPYCDFKSKFLGNIQRHVSLSNVHPGNKLYNCPFCVQEDGNKDEESSGRADSRDNHRFSTKNVHKLVDHINTEHVEEKDFSYKFHSVLEIIKKVHSLLGIIHPKISR